MLWCLRLLTVLPGASLFDNETDFLLKRTITVLVFIWDSSLRGNKAWLMKPGESTTSCSLLKRHLQLHGSALASLSSSTASRLTINEHLSPESRDVAVSLSNHLVLPSAISTSCFITHLCLLASLSLSLSPALFALQFHPLIHISSNTIANLFTSQHQTAEYEKSKTKDGMLTSSSLVLRKNEDRTL